MIMGQSMLASEPRANEPLLKINPLIYRHSAIFGDVGIGVILNAWVEQDGRNQWATQIEQGNAWTDPSTSPTRWQDIDVSDLPVVRFK